MEETSPGSSAAAEGQTGTNTTPKKTYKLYIHGHTFSTESLIVRSDEFPDVVAGDVLEGYHEGDNFSRLLLQVSPESLFSDNNLSNKALPKRSVYVERSIADSFLLSTFKEVVVNKVCPESVALDSVELTFKDQYLGRSEMWRLKKSLVNSVMFINKKVSFCKDGIRCTVNEMWGQGERVACGFVTSDTKVVFR